MATLSSFVKRAVSPRTPTARSSPSTLNVSVQTGPTPQSLKAFVLGTFAGVALTLLLLALLFAFPRVFPRALGLHELPTTNSTVPQLNVAVCASHIKTISPAIASADRYGPVDVANALGRKNTGAIDAAIARHLGPLRNRAISVLEIGAGCISSAGSKRQTSPAQSSRKFWSAYLPCSRSTWIDFDAPCGGEDASSAIIHVGGSSQTALNRAFAQHGLFHVIFDGGGHSSRQQILTLQTFFPRLPPGGVYVVQGLLTFVLDDFLDGSTRGPTMNHFLSNVTAHLHRKEIRREHKISDGLLNGTSEIARMAVGVDCFREVCVLIRNEETAPLIGY